MECLTIRYFETLDVAVLWIDATAKFWPDIDKQVLRDFADTVPKDLTDRCVGLEDATSGQQASANEKPRVRCRMTWRAERRPFFQVNQFSWQDTNAERI